MKNEKLNIKGKNWTQLTNWTRYKKTQKGNPYGNLKGATRACAKQAREQKNTQNQQNESVKHKKVFKLRRKEDYLNKKTQKREKAKRIKGKQKEGGVMISIASREKTFKNKRK